MTLLRYIQWILVLIPLSVLLVWQGGFYPEAACSVGFAVAVLACVVWLWALGRPQRAQLDRWIILASLCLCSVGLFAIISAVYNGMSASMLLAACSWFGCAAVVFGAGLGALSLKVTRIRLSLCVIGIVSAAIALLIFALDYIAGYTADNGRLQSYFQYANATGIWFAVMTLLCVSSEYRTARLLALLPFAVMVLSQSVGAISLYIVCQAVMAIVGWRQKASWRNIAVALVALCVLACVAVVCLAPTRIAQAEQTIIERYIMLCDALALSAVNPWGVGPDAWSWLYPLYQTAQYRATVVHCSYLQIALDAGWAGLAAFLAYVICCLILALRSGNHGAYLAIILISVHALIDFDYRYAALICLPAIVVVSCETGQGVQRLQKQQSAYGWAALYCVFLGAICLVGVVQNVALSRAYSLGESADLNSLSNEFSSSWLLEGDVEANRYYASALAQSGSEQQLVNFAHSRNMLTGEEALNVSYGLFRANDDDEAGRVLVSALEREPYNVQLFDATASLFTTFGVPNAVSRDYKQALDRADMLAHSGNALLLDNQVEMPRGGVGNCE